MTGNATDYFAGQLWGWGFTDAAVTRPTQWWVGLFSSAPTNAGGGTEYSGAGYARDEATFDPTTKVNDDPIRFEAVGGDFPAGVAYGIFDAPTGGNLLIWKLKPIVAVTDGNAVEFRAGDLDGSVS